MKQIILTVENCSGCINSNAIFSFIDTPDEFLCGAMLGKECPKTGIPDWCPLEDFIDPDDNPGQHLHTL